MSFNPVDTTVAEVKKIVCDTAAELANDELGKQAPGLGRGFRETSTTGEGFCITYIGGELDGFPAKRRAELQLLINEIGRRAVKQAIRQHIDIITGLILGEARHGRNFFGDTSSGMSVIV